VDRVPECPLKSSLPRYTAAWPTHFMKDNELRWLAEEPAIDDL